MRMMNTLAGWILVGWILGSASATIAADAYVFDPAHSSIEFSVKHLVITNVKGSFDRFDGSISADPEKIEESSVNVTIDVASINTKNEKRDEHLRSSDFLDAENHPQITFRSSEIRKTNDGYVAAGTLTIRGVAKEVELPFALHGPITSPWGETVAGIEIAYEIDRQEFGVSWNQTLDTGGVVVGNEVRIEINLEVKKEA